jgi:hypothetical protein
MSLSEARARLAARQGELVRALVAGGEVPAGFDARRVARAARSLINKRLREVALAWPALAGCLAERFVERFRAYAETVPPPEGGPVADGERFARSLPPAERGDEVELMLLRLALGRRVVAVAVARLPASGRRVVGVRLPGLGVRVWGG